MRTISQGQFLMPNLSAKSGAAKLRSEQILSSESIMHLLDHALVLMTAQDTISLLYAMQDLTIFCLKSCSLLKDRSLLQVQSGMVLHKACVRNRLFSGSTSGTTYPASEELPPSGTTA